MHFSRGNSVNYSLEGNTAAVLWCNTEGLRVDREPETEMGTGESEYKHCPRTQGMHCIPRSKLCGGNGRPKRLEGRINTKKTRRGVKGRAKQADNF